MPGFLLLLLLLLLLLVTCFVLPGRTSSLLRPDEEPQEFATYRLYEGPSVFNATAPLSVASPESACRPLDNTEAVRGTLLAVSEDECSPVTKILNAQRGGAVGVILTQFRSTHGLLYYYGTERKQGEVKVPCVEVSFDDAAAIRKALEDAPAPRSVWASITPSNNPLEAFGEVPWALYTGLLLGFDLGILLLCTYKLVDFVKFNGLFSTELPNVILSLGVFTSLLRVPILLDPTGSRRLFPWSIVEFFLVVDFSFTIVANLVLAFHWDAVMRQSTQRVSPTGKFSLRVLKWPCILSCALLLVLELLTSALRAVWFNARVFLMIKVLLYVVLSLAVSIYFFWSGHRVASYLRRHKGVGGASADVWRRMVRLVYVCGTSQLLFMITAALVPTPIYTSPRGYFALRLLASIFCYVPMFMQAWTFEAGAVAKRLDSSASTMKSITVEDEDEVAME